MALSSIGLTSLPLANKHLLGCHVLKAVLPRGPEHKSSLVKQALCLLLLTK